MDDEIVVNVKSKTQNNKKVNNKQVRINKIKKKPNKKKLKINKRVKIIGILLILVIATILLLSSSLFAIKSIVIEGNTELSDDKIISFSGLQLYDNIFKFNKSLIIENIKENAYIENAEIKRKFPSTVEITVEERSPKFMLQFADSYVYINNQGYMLEITNERLNIPILVGLTTDLSNIKAGNRINIDDLNKMEMVIKLYEVAKNNELADIITKIDISNTKNYTIILETEGKTVYLGECSNLNTRILTLKSILQKTKGTEGEIFLNMDLNNQKPYFRKKIN